MAIDPVPVGGGFGFSENPGRPLGHLAERCAIYLQPHHILLGYVCDRCSRCDSAWRESNHLFLPKHQTLTVAMVHIGYLKFANRKEHCSKRKRGSKNRPKKKTGTSWLRLNHFAAPSSLCRWRSKWRSGRRSQPFRKGEQVSVFARWIGDRETVRRISAAG
jgi:hypothetical protein